MKSNLIIGLVTASIIGIGGYFVYKTKFWVRKPKTKIEAISLIVSTGNSTNVNNTLSTFGEDYLLAWGEAIVNKKETFLLNGKEYITKGGKAKK